MTDRELLMWEALYEMLRRRMPSLDGMVPFALVCLPAGQALGEKDMVVDLDGALRVLSLKATEGSLGYVFQRLAREYATRGPVWREVV